MQAYHQHIGNGYAHDGNGRIEQNPHPLERIEWNDDHNLHGPNAATDHVDAVFNEQERIPIPDERHRIPATEDALAPLNYRDVAAFIINKMIVGDPRANNLSSKLFFDYISDIIILCSNSAKANFPHLQGTGIFVSPATVLILTKNKGEALGLWVLSFVYVLVRYVNFCFLG